MAPFGVASNRPEYEPGSDNETVRQTLLRTGL